MIIAQISIPKIPVDARWTQDGTTVAGGNGDGNGLHQLSKASGVCVLNGSRFYVADRGNHRIVEWKKDATSGQVVAGGNGQGNQNDQLDGPRNVIVDQENDALIICDRGNQRVVRWPLRSGATGKTIISNIDCFDLILGNNGYLYISDISKHEVRRWKLGETNGIVVAGGNGQGNRLDQLDCPWYIFVDEDHSVYVSDNGNHRVMKWMKGAKEGIIVAGGHGEGRGLAQLSYPGGIVVDQPETVYVADYNNHRVMRWMKGASRGSIVVGGNGLGKNANQFCYPSSLSFDRQNNLYVVDFNNHRVQKFAIDSNSNPQLLKIIFDKFSLFFL